MIPKYKTIGHPSKKVRMITNAEKIQEFILENKKNINASAEDILQMLSNAKHMTPVKIYSGTNAFIIGIGVDPTNKEKGDQLWLQLEEDSHDVMPIRELKITLM